jgi:hypothetical protein
LSDFISVTSYEIVKRLSIPIYYFYFQAVIEFLFMLYLLLHDVYFNDTVQNNLDQGFLRDFFHDTVPITIKEYVYYSLGGIYLLILIFFLIISILVVKKDALIYRESVIIDWIFRGLGHSFIIINYVTFIPSLIIFSDPIRCQEDTSVPPTTEFPCLKS